MLPNAATVTPTRIIALLEELGFQHEYDTSRLVLTGAWSGAASTHRFFVAAANTLAATPPHINVHEELSVEGKPMYGMPAWLGNLLSDFKTLLSITNAWGYDHDHNIGVLDAFGNLVAQAGARRTDTATVIAIWYMLRWHLDQRVFNDSAHMLALLQRWCAIATCDFLPLADRVDAAETGVPVAELRRLIANGVPYSMIAELYPNARAQAFARLQRGGR